MKDETWRRFGRLVVTMACMVVVLMFASWSLSKTDAPLWADRLMSILIIFNPAWYREGRR